MSFDSAVRLIADMTEGTISCEAVMAHFLQKIEENQEINSFITVNPNALEEAKALDKKRASAQPLGRLFGLPIAVKDLVLTKGLRTTCASESLEDYIPPYDATVIERIKAEDGIVLGKTNMDEFAMGSSSETSHFGITKNPIDPTRVPGGSSSGSASAVRSGEAPIAIASDTGGSIRQPSSYCSVFGYYPSYGTVSRYGVVPMANTLDQVGVISNHVEDAALLVDVIGGADEKDPTSRPVESPGLDLSGAYSLSGKRIGYPSNLGDFDMDPEVAESFQRGIDILKEQGAVLEPVTIETLTYALPTYNIIVTSEVSSNMSRYDGIRFGKKPQDYTSNGDLYEKARTRYLGEEIQRRIAMGTLYLGSDSDQKLYKKALLVRRKLANEFTELFEQYDFFVTPTTNHLPIHFGERIHDAMAMYDSDLFTVSVNLCGLCAVSIPMQRGLGGSMQLVANRYDDQNLLCAAQEIERSLR